MLFNRKILMSAAIIGVVGVGGYLGARALFIDTETSTESTFTVGTLDLDVDNNSLGFDRFEVTNIGADGTVSGGKTWTITNTGTIPGNLTFSISSLVNNENDCNEPEGLVDVTCDNPGAGQGELGDAISTTVALEGTNVVTSDLATANQTQYATQWDANAGVVELGAGESVDVTMDWSTDPSSYGNEIQSDSLSFDIAFQLEQVTPQ